MERFIFAKKGGIVKPLITTLYIALFFSLFACQAQANTSEIVLGISQEAAPRVQFGAQRLSESLSVLALQCKIVRSNELAESIRSITVPCR